MTAVAAPPLSPADLESLPNGERFELVRGELVERTMGNRSVWVAGRIHRRLDEFLDGHPEWLACPDGTRYLISVDGDEQVRIPDVSVISRARLPGGRITEAISPFAPDLAVEVMSPTDRLNEVEAKIADYFSAGTKLVWLVRPESRKVTVIQPDGSESTVSAGGELTGDPLFPDFRLNVAEIFPDGGRNGS
jgi:Uma2 family endonuclease